MQSYMAPLVYQAVGPLVEYTEPINTRIFRKAEVFSDAEQAKFKDLREEFADFALYSSMIGFGNVVDQIPFFQNKISNSMDLVTSAKPPLVPGEVAESKNLKDFTYRLISHAEYAIDQFDDLFGERA